MRDSFERVRLPWRAFDEEPFDRDRVDGDRPD